SQAFKSCSANSFELCTFVHNKCDMIVKASHTNSFSFFMLSETNFIKFHPLFVPSNQMKFENRSLDKKNAFITVSCIYLRFLHSREILGIFKILRIVLSDLENPGEGHSEPPIGSEDRSVSGVVAMRVCAIVPAR
ncbi:hypothetical protein L9F63_022876, partial [Diploptera punctata]